MNEFLEIGAKIQKTYMNIRKYYDSVIEQDINSLDEDHEYYEYVMLCQLLMDKLIEDFPFIKED